LRPRFYQTIWFYAVCGLGVVGFGFGGYHFRIQHLKAREKELARLVEERTRQLEEANQELKRLSFLDGLTGIANRRHFDHILDIEWRRAVRSQTPISVILIDVDFFKLYNDTYGHQKGDRCLKQVAQILSKTSNRAGDLVARYGGEEFAAILPGASAKDAAVWAEIVRQGVEQAKIPHESSKASAYVTISIGIAGMIPEKDVLPDVLLATADQALYQAKGGGRNQIKIAETVEQPTD
jgi:diguanylate cyclase (GGDEF)-like protein